MAEDFNPGLNDEKTNPEDNQQPGPTETEVQPGQDNNQQPDNPARPAKPPTKAELEVENARLLEQNEQLKRMIPNHIQPKEGYKVVFIKSNGVPAVPKNGKKYIEGSVNGKKFEVLCDQQVEVSDEIAEALQGVIKAQS